MSTATVQVDSQQQQTEQEVILTVDSRSSTPQVSLPSIETVLEKIEHYQNQQKLSDSQLLLELTQRQDVRLQQPLPPPTPQQSTIVHTHDPNAFLQNHPLPVPPQQQQQKQQQQQQLYSYGYQHPVPPQHQMSQPQMATWNDPQRGGGSLEIKLEDGGRGGGKRLSRSVSKQMDQNSENNSLTRSPSMESMGSVSGGSGSLTPGTTTGSLDSSFGNNNNNKKRTNLPRETIEILNDWILNNMDNPYPNHSQKRILLERTGLSNVQLSNWFINKRRRRIFSKLSGNNGQPIKKKRLIDRI